MGTLTRIKKVLRSQEGSVSLFVLLICVGLFPLLLFITIAWQNLITDKVILKSVTDNAVASAVTCTSKSHIAAGIIYIENIDRTNSTNANTCDEVINAVLEKGLKVGYDGTNFTLLSGHKILAQAPEGVLQIFNTPGFHNIITYEYDEDLEDYVQQTELVYIAHPTIVLTMKYTVRSLVTGDLVTFGVTSSSQVKFKS